MKTILQFVSCVLLSLVSASAAITRNASVSWISTAAPGNFNASNSDKLVVVVSGEHNFVNNYTGTCSAVTYNGQALTRALLQAPANPSTGGHGQTHSSIWYLDNPGNYAGSNTIAVTCTGTNWVATAIGLSGTLPGVSATAKQSGAATASISTNGYGSLIIAACGMGGQGNTATPLPGVVATVPSGATTLAGLKIGSNWAGHAVGSAEIPMPSTQTFTFNTAKTDLVTVAAAFSAANPTMPDGPTPLVRDMMPGESVELAWSNFLPNIGSNVWVDVWIGDSPANLQRVVSADPAGLNLTSTLFTAPAPGIYHGRIDSYLQGSSSGTPHPGTPFSFEVSKTGLRMETWLGLRPLPSLLALQREGIAQRPPNNSLRLNGSALQMPVPGGIRLRGLFKPETSGSYKFHVAGSENTALWISPDDSRFHKERIAWQLNPSAISEWNKCPTQTSAPIELQANVSYYIEAQVMNSIGNGHLEIGWTPPGATAAAVIPAALLSCPPANPDDSNENNLPDSWENSTGLDVSNLPGAHAEYGDPDNDGISNFDESQLNSNPLAKDALADGLTRDTWTNVTTGYWMSDFTSNRAVFLDHPNETTHVPAIDDNARGEYYCSRYRGFLTAPATGYYRFWIAGNKKSELWLANGTVKYPGTTNALTNRFGKQCIALNANPQSNLANAPYDFDQYPEQRSRVVYLVENQRYYIEALHKQLENPTANHVAVAWQVPGQLRTLIPATAFTSDVPDDNDPDGDFLPSAWESLTPAGKPAHNLNPTDSGLTDANSGQFGDPDVDGLSNFEEFQLGTHPRLADTDGDGLSDKAERDYYHTNPLISNAIQSGPLVGAPLTLFTASSIPWDHRPDGSAVAYERRGWIDYPITVAAGQEGIHEITLIGGAEGGSVRSTEKLPISFHLDGSRLGHHAMTCRIGQNTTLKQLTPWLKAGTYILRVENHNVRADCNLRINSLTVQRLGGTPSNPSDPSTIPLWALDKLQSENHLTRLPATSRTSPACIEGVSPWPVSIVSRRVGVPPTSSTTTAASGPDNIFYANIPLDQAGPTDLTITLQNGALVQAPHSITWTPTNILAEHNTTLTIRKGDKLLLTAYQGATPDGTFTLQSGAGILPAALSNPQNSASPVQLEFITPGTHTLTATWTPEGGSQTEPKSLTVIVKSADFGPDFIIQTYNRRTWTLPGINGLDIQATSTLAWVETTAPGAPARSFTVDAYEASSHPVLARVPETGDIIAMGNVNAFDVARVGETADAQTVEIRADGTRVFRFTVVAGDLPENVELRLSTLYSGATFPDGGRNLVLKASDFDSNGIADVLIEWTGTGEPRLCHSLKVYLKD